MLDYVKLAFTRYFDFKGRSRRSEFWYFYLFTIIAGFLAGFIDGLTGLFNTQSGIGPFNALTSLALLIPSISAGVRRMHDINKSGWWILVPFYSIYLLAKNGDVGNNRFGQDPKNPVATMVDSFN
jgi:uncharacterized membrane protein YhaH (DUF805 family)